MDKEKILAEFQEKIATDTSVLGAFRATNILEQILNSFVDEDNETALRVWKEYENYVDKSGVRAVTFRSYLTQQKEQDE